MIEEDVMLERLRDSIVELEIDTVTQLCREALDVGISAYDAIIKGMAKGMEIVGQKYEDGEYYLAELIMAGKTMRARTGILSHPALRAHVFFELYCACVTSLS